MEIRIEKDDVNKILNRREIEFVITYAERTPSREEVKGEIVHKLALKPETTAVVKIDQVYGARMSKVLVHSYSSKEAFALEQKHLAERSNKKKEEKEPEAKAEVAPAKKEEKAAKTETKEKIGE